MNRLSPSSGPRKRSGNAVSKANVSLSYDSGYWALTPPAEARRRPCRDADCADAVKRRPDGCFRSSPAIEQHQREIIESSASGLARQKRNSQTPHWRMVRNGLERPSGRAARLACEELVVHCHRFGEHSIDPKP